MYAHPSITNTVGLLPEGEDVPFSSAADGRGSAKKSTSVEMVLLIVLTYDVKYLMPILRSRLRTLQPAVCPSVRNTDKAKQHSSS